MNLSELYRNKKYKTDKNSIHSYIDHLYNNLFHNKRDINSLLEIGVKKGGSLLLWADYFGSAKIYGIDNKLRGQNINHHRIIRIIKNAYTIDTIKTLSTYDIIIDDGSHLLDDVKFFITNYIHLLNKNGIAIIEDIQDYSWFDILINLIATDIFQYEIIDLRSIKNRYDDMLLVVKKMT